MLGKHKTKKSVLSFPSLAQISVCEFSKTLKRDQRGSLLLHLPNFTGSRGDAFHCSVPCLQVFLQSQEHSCPDCGVPQPIDFGTWPIRVHLETN